jgi:ubiquinone/menaquinone biosynthesis C-methylase UbiE
MHQQAYNLIKRFAETLPKGLKVLDVGSMDMNGSLKDLFNKGDYIGLDIAEGKNVDIVSEPFNFPLADDSVDVVVSSSCLEHVSEPRLWANEIIRVLKSGGRLAITAPHTIHYHNSPHYWNIRKDGLMHLFRNLQIDECGEDKIDAYLYATEL